MLDMLESADSLAESSKCVATGIGQEPEAPAQNYTNWTLRFGKPDYPILSIPAVVRGTASTR
jgi:hypothetical protein